MLRLVEHYASVQGEGPRAGTLTQFVRFAGCNMRCPGWPCDTQHAIQPSIWRTNSYKRSATELANDIRRIAQETGAYNICLTGGEPFMQDTDELWDALQQLAEESAPFKFEVFTNGSFVFPSWTKQKLGMLFMMDWKLGGSGEALTKLGTRIQNARFLRPDDGIKFVLTSEDDFHQALGWAERLLTEYSFRGTFWVAAAYGVMQEKDLVDLMIKHRLRSWKLNVQVHKYIWPADMQGV